MKYAILVNYDYIFALPEVGISFYSILCQLSLLSKFRTYVSEIFRSGILAIDKGQMGRTFSRTKLFSNYEKLIIYTSIKNSLPSLGNEFISLVKESSIVIVANIYVYCKILWKTLPQTFGPYLVAAAIYLLLRLYYVIKRLKKVK